MTDLASEVNSFLNSSSRENDVLLFLSLLLNEVLLYVVLYTVV